MKCYQCGFEREEEFTFCPNCGFSAPSAPPQAPSASAVILPALQDPMFLILCILMSALCLISLSAGSMPLLNILFAVFLWLTYAQARKGIADARHLRCISGVVYAQYVILLVVGILLAVCGVILAVAFGALANSEDFIGILLSGIADVDPEVVAILSGLTSLSGGLIAFVFIFAAAIVIVLNIFSNRYIHGFAKSIYQSVEQEKLELKHLGATKVWLIIVTVSAGINMINSFGNITAMATNLVTLGTTLFATLLVHKYFK